MAVDTAAKRYSMLSFAGENGLIVEPDGTIAAVDRQHLLWAYIGILFEAPAAPAIIDSYGWLLTSQTAKLGTNQTEKLHNRQDEKLTESIRGG